MAVTRKYCPRPYGKIGGQSGKSHVLRNDIVRNEQIPPRLTTVPSRMLGGKFAPFDRSLLLGVYLDVIEIAARFHFKQRDALHRLRYKVRLIFQVLAMPAVKNLELALGGAPCQSG